MGLKVLSKCRRFRHGRSRHFGSSAWFARDGVKLVLIALIVIFFAFSMLSASVHSPIIPISPSDPATIRTNQRKASSQNAVFYPFHSIGRILAQKKVADPSHTNGVTHINPHDFNFTILESDVCAPAPFLLTVVHTHPANYKRRMVIRETWGTGASTHENGANLKLIVMFMMGSTSTNPGLMEAVKAESERYKDIVQENFEDSYRNLTYKAVMWLKWSSMYCPKTRYLLKVDDDILVNTFNLINHLSHLQSRNIATQASILCLVWHRMQVIRNPQSKWYVTKDEYPDDYFSNYCSGSAYILTGDLLEPMYAKALGTKFFWVDDFYVTGLLPRSLGVQYHNIASLYALKQADVRDKLLHNNALFGHVPRSLTLRYKLWKEILYWRGLGDRFKNVTSR